jgi:hypothetical protein
LCALTVEAAAMARVPLAGSNWIPGINEKKWLLLISYIRKINYAKKFISNSKIKKN